MRFEEALKAMRIGKVVYNKQEPDFKYGIDNNKKGNVLWYKCKGMKYYFLDEIGLHQNEILSEDWEILND